MHRHRYTRVGEERVENEAYDEQALELSSFPDSSTGIGFFDDEEDVGGAPQFLSTPTLTRELFFEIPTFSGPVAALQVWFFCCEALITTVWYF